MGRIGGCIRDIGAHYSQPRRLSPQLGDPILFRFRNKIQIKVQLLQIRCKIQQVGTVIAPMTVRHLSFPIEGEAALALQLLDANVERLSSTAARTLNTRFTRSSFQHLLWISANKRDLQHRVRAPFTGLHQNCANAKKFLLLQLPKASVKRGSFAVGRTSPPGVTVDSSGCSFTI